MEVEEKKKESLHLSFFSSPLLDSIKPSAGCAQDHHNTYR